MRDSFGLVKEKLPVAPVATRAGAEKQGGHWNPAPCCGHKDCFSLNEVENLWKCHSCGSGGSVIDLLMIVEGTDRAGALRIGAKLAGVEIATAPPEPRNDDKSVRILDAAAKYYRESIALWANAGQRAATRYFIEKRGHAEQTAEKMNVGYSDGELLPHLIRSGFTEEQAIKAGLYVVQKNGKKLDKPRDYFWEGFCIFPITDHDGRVISFTGKLIEKKGKFGGIVFPGKKNWFINHQALGRYSELFVVEGENDVASLMDGGCDNVIGTAGQPSADQVRLLKNHMKGKKLFLWFDADEGGAGHARKLYRALAGSDVTVKIIQTPPGANDPDEFLQARMR